MKMIKFSSLTIWFTMLSQIVFGQWKNELVNNGFDPPFKTSITKQNNSCFLQLLTTTVDEERVIIAERTIYDTIIKTKYSPEFPDGYIDTIVTEKKEYDYDYKEVKNTSLILVGGYHCKAHPKVEILLIVSGETKKYTYYGSTFKDSRGIYLVQDVTTNPEFLNDFKLASKIKIRINEEYCEDEYYEFSMSGSTAALNYVIQE